MSGGLDTASTAGDASSLTASQQRFFHTFGYLVVRAALRDDMTWIGREFEAVFRDLGATHRGKSRTVIVSFIDQRERLCTLLDHPAIVAPVADLIGPEFNYLGSDGNYYSGDTAWHSDGMHEIGIYMKAAIYLDKVDRDSGALRVIPGSHRHLDWDARGAPQSHDRWGIHGSQVPAVALECEPGDLVLFNHNIMHSSWGGGPKRRMFTLNFGTHASTAAELTELRGYISHLHTYLLDHAYGDKMRNSVSLERRVHLDQVIANEYLLPGQTAARRRAGLPSLAFDPSVHRSLLRRIRRGGE